MRAKEIIKINITPTWESLLPIFENFIYNGTIKQKEYVCSELKKLCLYVDNNKKEQKIMIKVKINKKNLVDYIIQYESGELSDNDTLDLFAYLVKTGQVYSLQGHYGRTATALLQDNFINQKGEVLKYV